MTGGGPMPGGGCSTVEKRGRERYQVGGSNSCHREPVLYIISTCM